MQNVAESSEHNINSPAHPFI